MRKYEIVDKEEHPRVIDMSNFVFKGQLVKRMKNTIMSKNSILFQFGYKRELEYQGTIKAICFICMNF